MYGVVEVKGHQYRVTPGDVINVQKMDAEEGAMVDLNDVLFIGGEKPVIGAPVVNGAKVVAKVVKHGRDRKIRILKRFPGRYMKQKGHRQSYTSLFITEVADGQGNTDKVASDNKFAQKYLK